MKRREFLKYGSLILPATAAMGVINPFTKKIFAAEKSAGSFSLSVITDQPSITIHIIEQAIKHSEYGRNTLLFSEYSLKGRHVGDIAYIKSRKLVDYHKGTDKFSRMLYESANSLSLPKTIDNPVLLQFSSGQNFYKPGDVNIFRGDVLIKQLPLDKDLDHLRIKGLKGHVDIKIENRYVSITSATCIHKTCMNMAPISKPGENLICIPNQINISIAGEKAVGVDSITF
jgi:hypothetical protein